MINSNDRFNLVPAPGVSACELAIREAGRFGYDAGRADCEDAAKVLADVGLLLIRRVADEYGDIPAGEALLNFAAGYRFGSDDWRPFDPGDRA